MKKSILLTLLVITISTLNISCDSSLLTDIPETLGMQASTPVVTVDYTSATITWTTDSPAYNRIEYGTTTGSYTKSTLQSTSATTTHTIVLSGLDSGTIYYYRITNTSSDYPDYQSGEMTFTTYSDTVPTLSQKQRGIWLVGGLSTAAITGVVTQIDLFDPVTETWYPDVANAATGSYTPVSFASYTAYNNKIYIIGGFASSGNLSSLVQIYDTVNNSWSNGNSASYSPRANTGSFMWDGKIYLPGGTTGSASTVYGYSPTTNQIYNIGGDNWSTGLSLGNYTARSGAVFNGTVFVSGGNTTTATTLTNTHDGYITSTNVLSSGATEVVLPSARIGHTVIIYNKSGSRTSMILLGGFTAITGRNGNYVFQGTTATTPQSTAAYLDYPFTAGAIWTDMTNTYPVSHGFAAAAFYNDILYVFGGATSQASGGITTAYKNDFSGFPGSAWTAITAMPVGRFGHGALRLE